MNEKLALVTFTTPNNKQHRHLSGKVQWGESFTDAAKRVLKIETNLDADFEFKMIFRKYDRSDEAHSLLEDKIFVIMQTNQVRGELLKHTFGSKCKKSS